MNVKFIFALLLIFKILVLSPFSNVKSQTRQPSIFAQGEKFAAEIETSLKQSSLGWGYEIRKNGKVLRTKSGGFKVAAVDNSKAVSLPFDLTSRIHVASVSKTITAIAVAKLVELGKLNYDDKISKYLPSFWKIHKGFENTTVKDLLIMKSGVDGKLDGASSHLDSLRTLIENGPTEKFVGTFNYQNTSYGLLRVIIAYASGVSESATSSAAGILSIKTANAYTDFVNEHLFKTAGITRVFCFETSSEPVLMYPFPYNNEQGYLTGGSANVPNGNLTEYAGGFGWYLSVNELGNFLNAVFFKKTVIRPASLVQLMSLNFPFRVVEEKFGKYFGSGGDWSTPVEAKVYGGVHVYYYFFPNNLQIVVFVNSGSKGLRNLIVPAYIRSLTK